MNRHVVPGQAMWSLSTTLQGASTTTGGKQFTRSISKTCSAFSIKIVARSAKTVGSLVWQFILAR